MFHFWKHVSHVEIAKIHVEATKLGCCACGAEHAGGHCHHKDYAPQASFSSFHNQSFYK
jgi:hypothetical protein